MTFKIPLGRETHLILVHLLPGEVYEGHLNGFTLDPVDEPVTDGATHDEEEGGPGDVGGSRRASQRLVQDLGPRLSAKKTLYNKVLISKEKSDIP